MKMAKMYTLEDVRSRASYSAKSATDKIEKQHKSQAFLNRLGTFVRMVEKPSSDVSDAALYNFRKRNCLPAFDRMFDKGAIERNKAKAIINIDRSKCRYQAEDDPINPGNFIIKYRNNEEVGTEFLRLTTKSVELVETIHCGFLDGSINKDFTMKQLTGFLKHNIHFDATHELPLVLLDPEQPDDDVFVTMEKLIDNDRYLAALQCLAMSDVYTGDMGGGRNKFSDECIKAIIQVVGLISNALKLEDEAERQQALDQAEEVRNRLHGEVSGGVPDFSFFFFVDTSQLRFQTDGCRKVLFRRECPQSSHAKKMAPKTGSNMLLVALKAILDSNNGKISESVALVLLEKSFDIVNVHEFYLLFKDHPAYHEASCTLAPLPSRTTNQDDLPELKVGSVSSVETVNVNDDAIDNGTVVRDGVIDNQLQLAFFEGEEHTVTVDPVEAKANFGRELALSPGERDNIKLMQLSQMVWIAGQQGSEKTRADEIKRRDQNDHNRLMLDAARLKVEADAKKAAAKLEQKRLKAAAKAEQKRLQIEDDAKKAAAKAEEKRQQIDADRLQLEADREQRNHNLFAQLLQQNQQLIQQGQETTSVVRATYKVVTSKKHRPPHVEQFNQETMQSMEGQVLFHQGAAGTPTAPNNMQSGVPSSAVSSGDTLQHDPDTELSIPGAVPAEMPPISAPNPPGALTEVSCTGISTGEITTPPRVQSLASGIGTQGNIRVVVETVTESPASFHSSQSHFRDSNLTFAAMNTGDIDTLMHGTESGLENDESGNKSTAESVDEVIDGNGSVASSDDSKSSVTSNPNSHCDGSAASSDDSKSSKPSNPNSDGDGSAASSDDSKSLVMSNPNSGGDGSAASSGDSKSSVTLDSKTLSVKVGSNKEASLEEHFTPMSGEGGNTGEEVPTIVMTHAPMPPDTMSGGSLKDSEEDDAKVEEDGSINSSAELSTAKDKNQKTKKTIVQRIYGGFSIFSPFGKKEEAEPEFPTPETTSPTGTSTQGGGDSGSAAGAPSSPKPKKKVAFRSPGSLARTFLFSSLEPEREEPEIDTVLFDGKQRLVINGFLIPLTKKGSPCQHCENAAKGVKVFCGKHRSKGTKDQAAFHAARESARKRLDADVLGDPESRSFQNVNPQNIDGVMLPPSGFDRVD
ncbi:expressed unknown protein [Seminavis robusta]|uniref:Uncharacterized protein n=1 Tax=Seminavis robusta TaxID=568900 RepID=A0A9N8EG63_9STRA|nr:expressed unknown protein [Seminavis robusta]|eukprot:Sro1148_g246500.1 n/a (1143) ;mRNA; f:16970-20473